MQPFRKVKWHTCWQPKTNIGTTPLNSGLAQVRLRQDLETSKARFLTIP